MGCKGDLLELIDGAPLGVSTLSGSLWTWTHHERQRRALTARAGYQGGSQFALGARRPDRPTTDEHLRVWVQFPDRWRIESDDQVDVRNGGTRWNGTATRITRVDHDGTGLEATSIGLLLAAGSQLFGAVEFGDPTEDTVAGRPCLRADARVTTGRAGRHLPIGFLLGGPDHTFWFDRATGVVLRYVGRIEDQPFVHSEFKDIRINPVIEDLDFEFVPPPGAVVERRVDQLIRLAEGQGIDLSGVDREDPRAVQTALHAILRPAHPTPKTRREGRRAKHIPVGDPPDDETAARAAIEYAFTHCDETDGPGTALVNVQGGDGLVGPLHQAQQRVPVPTQGQAAMVVDDIHFLRSDQAVVWFSIDVDGQRFSMVDGREGRAVKVGGRWLIEHATIVGLLGFAGVAVPPAD